MTENAYKVLYQPTGLTMASLIQWLTWREWPDVVILTIPQFAELAVLLADHGLVDHKAGTLHYAGVCFARVTREATHLNTLPQDWPS